MCLSTIPSLACYSFSCPTMAPELPPGACYPQLVRKLPPPATLVCDSPVCPAFSLDFHSSSRMSLERQQQQFMNIQAPMRDMPGSVNTRPLPRPPARATFGPVSSKFQRPSAPHSPTITAKNNVSAQADSVPFATHSHMQSPAAQPLGTTLPLSHNSSLFMHQGFWDILSLRDAGSALIGLPPRPEAQAVRSPHPTSSMPHQTSMLYDALPSQPQLPAGAMQPIPPHQLGRPKAPPSKGIRSAQKITPSIISGPTGFTFVF